MYLERAAASRAERCERRRACGSRARGGRAGARLERAAASRAERAAASRAERAAARPGGVAGGAGGRSGRAEGAGGGAGGAGRVLRGGPYRR